MILRWIMFILLQSPLIYCECNYLVNKSDSTLDVCMNNKCHEFIDPYWIMVRPSNCKTKYFSLTFSTYKKFHLFLNDIRWELTDLFPSKIDNQIRQLRIYIKQIDFNDRPTDESELNRLGSNIDLYELYLQNITSNNYLYRLIHYDPNDPQWDIIQIQFQCHSLMRMDENKCPTQIIPPLGLAPRRPLITTILLITTTQFSSSLSPPIEQPIEENSRSIHLIILILIPLLIVLITLLISIFVYMRKRFSSRDLTSLTPRSSSIPSISHHLDSKNGSYSDCRPSVIPYQVSRLPSPHKDSLYKEPEQHF